jgi:hypothetical protein
MGWFLPKRINQPAPLMQVFLLCAKIRMSSAGGMDLPCELVNTTRRTVRSFVVHHRLRCVARHQGVGSFCDESDRSFSGALQRNVLMGTHEEFSHAG